MRDKEQEWICEHLKICGYQVEDVCYLDTVEIELQHQRIYLAKLRFFGELVDRIVLKRRQCLSMISDNIQVSDMFGKDDKVIFPRTNGREVNLAERRPLLNSDPNPNAVFFYEDYVLLREHFFEKNQCIQLVCGVRTDEAKGSLNYGKYGRYEVTIITDPS